MFDNFLQDSIFYPEEGVKHALKILWKMADSQEMSTEQLQKKLQEIAYWISNIEKTTKKFQPEWCYYY